MSDLLEWVQGDEFYTERGNATRRMCAVQPELREVFETIHTQELIDRLRDEFSADQRMGMFMGISELMGFIQPISHSVLNMDEISMGYVRYMGLLFTSAQAYVEAIVDAELLVEGE